MNEEEYKEHLKNSPEGMEHYSKFFLFMVDVDKRIKNILDDRSKLFLSSTETPMDGGEFFRRYDALFVGIVRELVAIGKEFVEFKLEEEVRTKKEIKRYDEAINRFTVIQEHYETLKSKLDELEKTINESNQSSGNT